MKRALIAGVVLRLEGNERPIL